MNDASRCSSCGASISPGTTPCPRCGSLLAGAREVAVEALRQEALMAYDLLESAGLHPILTYQDDSGRPHPIDPEEPFSRGGGLIVPVTTTFAVYVPASEAEDAEQVLEDARTSRPEADA